MNAQTRIVNSLTGIVTLLVFSIGAGAFVLSYDALYATGQTHGSFVPGKVWIFPLLIDAPLVVFTLALLVSQILRQSVKLWAGLVILYTLATIGFNLSHAQPTPLGWTIAIVAPVGLLLTTEALRHLAKNIIERQAVIDTLAEMLSKVDTRQKELNTLALHLDTKQQELNNLAVKRDDLQRQIEALKIEQKALKIEGNLTPVDNLLDGKDAAKQERLNTLLDYLTANPYANLTEAGKHLDVSRQTVATYVNQLTEAGKLYRNGQGWEVTR